MPSSSSCLALAERAAELVFGLMLPSGRGNAGGASSPPPRTTLQN